MDLKAEAAEWDSTILESMSEENGWWMEALFVIFLGYINYFIYFYLSILSPVLSAPEISFLFSYSDKWILYVSNGIQPSLILSLLTSHT